MSKSLKILILFCATLPVVFGQVRLKDITDIKGCAEMQVIGYGIVVGLDRTGDGTKSEFTIQSIVNMLERFGLQVDPKQIKPKNVAAVMVTAELSPYSRPGSRVDVLVSSISDATSLQGGVLLMTPLLGVDGEVYIQVQGAVSVGGVSAGGDGGSVSQNHTLVGRIPGGGVALQRSPIRMEDNGLVTFLLRNPDFTTASRIASVLNDEFNQPIAMVLDAGTIEARVPPEMYGASSTVEFISRSESLEIVPDVPARVVINERTGTVVVGSKVRLSQVAITHGALSISITPTTQVSQPGPFSQGTTQTVESNQIQVEAEGASMVVLDETPDVESVAKALNALGVKPRDVVAIFQALKQAGALQADLVII